MSGFQLMGIFGVNTKRLRKKEIIEIGKKLADFNIPYIYTGHCTGKPAYKILKNKLGNRLHYLGTGSVIEI